MNKKIRMVSILCSLLLLLSMFSPVGNKSNLGSFFSTSAQAFTNGGGPVILMGIDAEDGGAGGHGPIHVYQTIVQSILAKVTNGGSGILVFGANSAYVEDFWNHISTGTGQNVKFVSESEIDSLSLNGYAMIAVASDFVNTTGGLTQSQHDKLVNRQNDIASFINNGGGLLGFASDFSNPYAYLGSVGEVKANINLGYDDITPNSEGRAIGITDELDTCCWHDEYTTYPDFLKELATAPSGNPAVIGGLQISVPSKMAVSPSTISIAQGQQISLKVEIEENSILTDITPTSTGTSYTSSSPDVIIDDNGNVSLLPSAEIGTTSTITVSHGEHIATVVVKVDQPVVELTEIIAEDTIELGPGERFQLNVNALYNDGTSKDVTYSSSGTTYESSMQGYVSVSPNGMVSVSSTAPFGETVEIIVKNQDKTTVVSLKISDAPTDIFVTPENADVTPGEQVQLKVIAELQDGTTKDITKNVTYISSDTSRTIVSKSGLATILDSALDGSVKIISTYAGIQKETNLTVGQGGDPDEIIAMEVTPATATVPVGKTQQLTVELTKADGTKVDGTLGATGTTYSSSHTNIATVDADGLVTVAAGAAMGQKATITVKNGTFTKYVSITAGDDPDKPISMNVTPATSTVPVGKTQQLTVELTKADGTKVDASLSTEGTTYSTSHPAIATVDADGLVTVAAGAAMGQKATITVKNGTFTKYVSITAGDDPDKPISMNVTPATSTVPVGKTQQLTVELTKADGTKVDASLSTEGTTYSTSHPAIATVDADGLVTVAAGAAMGQKATITVKNGTFTKYVSITAGDDPDKPISMNVTPATSTVPVGKTQQLTVELTKADGTKVDASLSTEGTTYSTSHPAIATVDADGLVTVAAGAAMGQKATITVKNGTFTKYVSITAGDDPDKPISMNVTPATSTVPVGKTQQLTVELTKADGTKVDASLSTEGTTYSTSHPAIATVDADGLVTVAAGAAMGQKATITVKNGTFTKYVSITAGDDPDKPISMNVTPATSTVPVGKTQQLTVELTKADGTKVDASLSTEGTTYSSSHTNIATVDVDGLVTVAAGAAVGQKATITVKNGTFTKYISITVGDDPEKVVAMDVTPLTALLSVGETQQLMVELTKADGSTMDGTPSVTGTSYSSSNLNIATVDADGLVTIEAGALKGQKVTITVKHGTFTKYISIEID
ncbi:Ig-like domain-containing protein [[Bacillus] enclensis]|uniref:Ig-like domain-containing protein n=1 Tax=[Bacillus] enclensis TaxID=1402860 RepID=UPI0018DB5A0D|nr:Ig-like domain-containing protein [[Bacillus] enclensis]MBH9968839.1 Ig-like domain-containing protein [[Bacillus] enclensis]